MNHLPFPLFLFAAIFLVLFGLILACLVLINHLHPFTVVVLFCIIFSLFYRLFTSYRRCD